MCSERNRDKECVVGKRDKKRKCVCREIESFCMQRDRECVCVDC